MRIGIKMIPAGARGFDALGDVTDATRLSRDGWAFRTFYVCQSNLTSLDGRKITENDIASGSDRIGRVINAGLGVLLNYESSSGRWRQGPAVGYTDGLFMAHMCEQLYGGYPLGLPVLISFDEDISALTLPAAVAYGRGFSNALIPRWGIGEYGEDSIIAALTPPGILGWNAMAGSWDVSPPTSGEVIHVQQRRPTAAETAAMPYATASALDVNVTRLPIPTWGAIPDPPPPPPTPEVATVSFDTKTQRLNDPQSSVGTLQVLLNVLANQGLAVDNFYGPMTETAVTNWQRQFGLAVDGVCGGQTWSSMLGILVNFHNFGPA